MCVTISVIKQSYSIFNIFFTILIQVGQIIKAIIYIRAIELSMSKFKIEEVQPSKLLIVVYIVIVNHESVTKQGMAAQQWQIDYQQYLNHEILCILQMDITRKQKIDMLEGFVSVLRQKQQKEKSKIKENLSTSFSEDPSNYHIIENQVEELQEKILEKRAIKFQINEEIQAFEEDLFEIEKLVDEKRQEDERLRKKIQKEVKNTDQPYFPQRSRSTSYLGTVSGLFKGWLS